MSGFEALNSVRWGANVIVVLFRDGAWGLVKEAQRRVYRRTPFTEIPSPDFRHLALSFGMTHVQIGEAAEIESGLDNAVAAKSPVLLEVHVDYAEAPPYLKGVGPQMFRNLEPRLKAGVVLRMLKRGIFPPPIPKP
jgi:thiamine pyrophosphate-dependent acetolactate synthase large subunit-like protein